MFLFIEGFYRENRFGEKIGNYNYKVWNVLYWDVCVKGVFVLWVVREGFLDNGYIIGDLNSEWALSE